MARKAKKVTKEDPPNDRKIPISSTEAGTLEEENSDLADLVPGLDKPPARQKTVSTPL